MKKQTLKFLVDSRVLVCLLFAAALVVPGNAQAVDGLYVGGDVGFVSLNSNPQSFQNALGFGLDLGVKTNPVIDLLFSSQYSSHSASPNGLSLYSELLGGNVHLGQIEDIDITADFGPGFYIFKSGNYSETDFGLHVGAGADLEVDDHLRVGLGYRWNGVMGGTIAVNYWTLMMRAGYWFDLD